MAARRGGGLIKQELAAAYGIDQSKANFLLELGLVDADVEYYAIISVWHTAGNRRIELAKGKRNPGLGGSGNLWARKKVSLITLLILTGNSLFPAIMNLRLFNVLIIL